MKILFFADLHLRSASDRPKWRTDDHYKTQFEELYEITDIAREQGVNWIISLGDFFDHTRVSHQLVTDVLKWSQSIPCYACSIVGNHDVNGYVTTDRNNGLGVLFESGALHQLKEFTIDTHKIIIRGVDVHLDPTVGDYMFDEQYNDYFKIIASHNFIIPHEVPFPAVLPSHVKTNANVIVLGHYHKTFNHFEGKTAFINPGSISRWAINEQHQPQVFILDTDTKIISAVFLKCSQPASKIFDLTAAAEMKSTEMNLQAFINSLEATSFENVDIENVVATEALKQNVLKAVSDLALSQVQQAKVALKWA
ncbi:MAG: metallophosphoesterase family protein [bacterium]